MLGFVDIFLQSETRGALIGVEKMCAAQMIRGDGSAQPRRRGARHIQAVL